MFGINLSGLGFKTAQYTSVVKQSCAVECNAVCSARQSCANSPLRRCSRLCSAVQHNAASMGLYCPVRCNGQCCAVILGYTSSTSVTLGFHAATETAIAVQLACQGDAVQSQRQGQGSQLQPTPHRMSSRLCAVISTMQCSHPQALHTNQRRQSSMQ